MNRRTALATLASIPLVTLAKQAQAAPKRVPRLEMEATGFRHSTHFTACDEFDNHTLRERFKGGVGYFDRVYSARSPVVIDLRQDLIVRAYRADGSTWGTGKHVAISANAVFVWGRYDLIDMAVQMHALRVRPNLIDLDHVHVTVPICPWLGG